MSQNITLRDGEIAVVIGNASIILNVNTAFEIATKLFVGCACGKQEKQDIDINKNDNKPKVVWPEDIEELTKEPEPAAFDPFANVPEVTSANNVGGKEKVPALVFTFDPERAARFNDLRAGVGKCIKRFDSMTGVDYHYGVTSGTASSVANTWLPYMYQTGAMSPMVGDKKNYRFSSKYNGKTLRWNFTPFYNKQKADRLVVFRADAVPQFIMDRYTKKHS